MENGISWEPQAPLARGNVPVDNLVSACVHHRKIGSILDRYQEYQQSDNKDDTLNLSDQ